MPDEAQLKLIMRKQLSIDKSCLKSFEEDMNDDGKAGKRLNAMIEQQKTKIDTEYCLVATKMPK